MWAADLIWKQECDGCMKIKSLHWWQMVISGSGLLWTWSYRKWLSYTECHSAPSKACRTCLHPPRMSVFKQNYLKRLSLASMMTQCCYLSTAPSLENVLQLVSSISPEALYLFFPAQDGHSAEQVQDRLLWHHRAGRHKHQAQEGAVSFSLLKMSHVKEQWGGQMIVNSINC